MRSAQEIAESVVLTFLVCLLWLVVLARLLEAWD